LDTQKEVIGRLKHEAHQVLEWHFPNRAVMYSWLVANFKHGHIADMGEAELRKVIKAGRKLANKKGKYDV
jgi:hypothetical protein